MRTLTLISLVSFSLIVSGCSYLPKVRKLDVAQGNIITEQAVGQLQPGMSSEDVQNILGTPLLISPYKDAPMYYVYTMQMGGGIIEKQHLVLYFTDDQLVNMITTVPPAGIAPEAPFIPSPLGSNEPPSDAAAAAEAAVDNAILTENLKNADNNGNADTARDIEQYEAIERLESETNPQGDQNLPAPFG